MVDLEGAEVCTSPALTAEQVAEHYAYGAKDFNKDKAYAEMALLGVTFGGGTKASGGIANTARASACAASSTVTAP